MWIYGSRSWTSALVMVAALGVCAACGNVGAGDGGEAPTACDVETTATSVTSSPRDSSVLVDDRFALVISADAHGVYWIGADRNLRMLAHGTTEARTVFQSPPSISGVSLDRDAIYFDASDTASDGHAVFRIGRDGAGLRALVSGLSRETIWSLPAPVLDAERVYFANNTGRVASVSKLGGEPVDTAISLSALHGLAVDESHLYWLEGDVNDSDLKRTAKTGGGGELLASGLKHAGMPQVVGDDVLFVVEHGLFAVPKTGGCARALIWDDTHRLAGFFAESGQVFYKRVFDSDTGFSSILRAPLSGGAAVELTQGGMRSAAGGIGLFADRLYWTSDAAVHVFEL